MATPFCVLVLQRFTLKPKPRKTLKALLRKTFKVFLDLDYPEQKLQ
jgi:hypothetical protein